MNVQSNPFLIPFCFESGHSELLPDMSDFMSACLLNCPLLLRVAAWKCLVQLHNLSQSAHDFPADFNFLQLIPSSFSYLCCTFPLGAVLSLEMHCQRALEDTVGSSHPSHKSAGVPMPRLPYCPWLFVVCVPTPRLLTIFLNRLSLFHAQNSHLHFNCSPREANVSLRQRCLQVPLNG